MERLQIYPLGENPKGKNYIFFAAHPADKDRGMETLWEDLSQFSDNSVIWHDATPNKPCDAAFWEALGLLPIRVVVVWVTRRLMERSAPFIKKLILYAQERDIRILPLVQELEMDSAYQDLFGAIQYLSAVDMDPTAVPYARKLELFLLDVLTDTETFQRVRNAFAGYIFMSYRKKDRILANKLMKMIHTYPAFRDIAIWYDEFLVPGESFDSAIRESMNSCDLFALLVTHHLLEPHNYVLKTEFPEAKAAGLRILPVQMGQTDQGALRTEFKGIPQKVNGQDYQALEAALYENLAHLLRETPTDPAHDYLIGLAYWNGIDVEMNRKLGEELITKAAKAGETGAMCTLANIYKQRAESILSGASAVTYWERYLQIMEHLYKDTQAEHIALNIAQACLRLNDLECLARGKPSKALHYCSRAKELLMNLTLTPQTAPVFDMLVNTYGTAACTLASAELHEQAKEEFEAGVALCDDIYAQSKDPVFLYKKCLLYTRQATTMRVARVPKVGRSMRVCNQCKEIAEELLVCDPVYGHRALRDLWEEYGEIHTALGNDADAAKARGEMLSQAEKAAKASAHWLDWYVYITALDEIGEQYLNRGDYRVAALYYDRIAEACDRIKQEQIPEPVQQGFLKAKVNLGQSLIHIDKREEAEKVIAEIYPVVKQIMDTTADPDDQYRCAAVLMLWGVSANDIELIAQAKALLTPILRMRPEEKEYQHLMTKIKEVLS